MQGCCSLLGLSKILLLQPRETEVHRGSGTVTLGQAPE